MVTFKISGSLPAPWEDFLSCTASVPNITIMTLAEAAEDGIDCGNLVAVADDGWLDLVVDVACIDIDAARLAIADALGINNPEHVLIIEGGYCQSF